MQYKRILLGSVRTRNIFAVCVSYLVSVCPTGETVQSFSEESFQRNGIMSDNIDGHEYREFLNKMTPLVADKVCILTLTLNTDRIAFFQSTKKSVWHYLLVIDELHKDCR